MDITTQGAVGPVRARTLTPSKQHSEGEERVHLFNSPGRGNKTISPLYQPLSFILLPLSGGRDAPHLRGLGEMRGARMHPSPSLRHKALLRRGWEAMGIGWRRGGKKQNEGKGRKVGGLISPRGLHPTALPSGLASQVASPLLLLSRHGPRSPL